METLQLHRNTLTEVKLQSFANGPTNIVASRVPSDYKTPLRDTLHHFAKLTDLALQVYLLTDDPCGVEWCSRVAKCRNLRRLIMHDEMGTNPDIEHANKNPHGNKTPSSSYIRMIVKYMLMLVNDKAGTPFGFIRVVADVRGCRFVIGDDDMIPTDHNKQILESTWTPPSSLVVRLDGKFVWQGKLEDDVLGGPRVQRVSTTSLQSRNDRIINGPLFHLVSGCGRVFPVMTNQKSPAHQLTTIWQSSLDNWDTEWYHTTTLTLSCPATVADYSVDAYET